MIGENGAGKSTFAKILTGVIRPDGGAIRLRGEPVDLHSPRDALRQGIALIPQELAYVPHLTVAENIVLGNWPSWRGLTWPRAWLRRAAENCRRFKIDARRRPHDGDAEIGRASDRRNRQSAFPQGEAHRAGRADGVAQRAGESGRSSRFSAGSPPRGSASSIFLIAWTRCTGSAIGSSCSAMENSSRPSSLRRPRRPS